MANNCYTTILLRNTPVKITALDEALKGAKNTEKKPFGGIWLGSLLIYMGYPDKDVGEGRICRCRGRIMDYTVHEGEINLYTETAWVPMLQTIKCFADRYAPNTEIYYRAEEPGCGLYWTNDLRYVGTYYVDGYFEGKYEYLHDIIDCSPETVARALEDCLKISKTKKKSDKYIQTLCNRANDLLQHVDPGYYMILGKYRLMDIADCD